MIWDTCTKCLQVIIGQDSESIIKCSGCETIFKIKDGSGNNPDKERKGR